MSWNGLANCLAHGLGKTDAKNAWLVLVTGRASILYFVLLGKKDRKVFSQISTWFVWFESFVWTLCTEDRRLCAGWSYVPAVALSFTGRGVHSLGQRLDNQKQKSEGYQRPIDSEISLSLSLFHCLFSTKKRHLMMLHVKHSGHVAQPCGFGSKPGDPANAQC